MGILDPDRVVLDVFFRPYASFGSHVDWTRTGVATLMLAIKVDSTSRWASETVGLAARASGNAGSMPVQCVVVHHLQSSGHVQYDHCKRVASVALDPMGHAESVMRCQTPVSPLGQRRDERPKQQSGA